MKSVLTTIFVVLMLVLLWNIGFIREYERPCNNRYTCAAASTPKITPEFER